MYVTVICMPYAAVQDFIRVRKLSDGRLYACPGRGGQDITIMQQIFLALVERYSMHRKADLFLVPLLVTSLGIFKGSMI